MSKVGLYSKLLAAASILCIGGPALVIYVTPTEEALFKKYNPELQKRSLENRQGRQEDFEQFVGRLKEYSKSDRPSEFNPNILLPISVWEAAAIDEAKTRAQAAGDERQRFTDTQKRRDEIRKQSQAD